MTNTTVISGDCLEVLAFAPSASVDLIVTSPPYADARVTDYGGVGPDDYVEWFFPRAQEFHRVLKPTGSFVLNIKERCEAGERHTFVLELIQAIRNDADFRWVEEYIWHKSTSAPGKWPNRFRDAWERCLHFSTATASSRSTTSPSRRPPTSSSAGPTSAATRRSVVWLRDVPSRHRPLRRLRSPRRRNRLLAVPHQRASRARSRLREPRRRDHEEDDRSPSLRRVRSRRP